MMECHDLQSTRSLGYIRKIDMQVISCFECELKCNAIYIHPVTTYSIDVVPVSIGLSAV
jgi:hypothetical protein